MRPSVGGVGVALEDRVCGGVTGGDGGGVWAVAVVGMGGGIVFGGGLSSSCAVGESAHGDGAVMGC